MHYQGLIESLVNMTRKIFGEALTGCYLHGSMAMGCFNKDTSDIDIIVIIESDITDRQKLKFMNEIVKLNAEGPAKGLELSIVKRQYCNPFVYPTPFELHFSPAHLQWFLERPDDYIKNMNGKDRDLAAHFKIINKYGIALSGEPVSKVFGEVPRKDYIDSIRLDVENAGEDILCDPVYIILNLCRVLAYLMDDLCLSKAQGGEWALENISDKYHFLINEALECYKFNKETQLDKNLAVQFAHDMLEEIEQNL